MATVTKRMLPVKLSALKRALYAVTGRGPTPVAAAVITPAPPAPTAAPAPLAFRDGSAPTLERVREQLEREAARAPRVPRGPNPPKRRPEGDAEEGPAPRGAGGLAERRRSAGLRPGQLDPTRVLPGTSKREQELIERKVGGRNWGAGAA
jgi:hypothetical protein